MSEAVSKKGEKFHHPKGLWLSCIGMGASSYLKYAVSGIAIFYYTYSVAQGGLGLSDQDAGLIISIAGLWDLCSRCLAPSSRTAFWDCRRR